MHPAQSSFHRVQVGGALILGPAALTAGWIIMTSALRPGPSTSWFVVHMFLFLGIILIVPALVWLVVLLPHKTSRLADAGFVIAIAGTHAIADQNTINKLGKQLAEDTSEMQRFFLYILPRKDGMAKEVDKSAE